MRLDRNVSSSLLSEYEAKRHIFEALRKSCQRLIGELLEMEQLQVLSISGRVKTKESLSEKIARPGKQYQALADVTDILGLRIVTFFEDDVDKVASLLEREFSLVREHCVDKRAYIEPDKFGYRSLHYVCGLSHNRKLLPENASFREEVFEVQVRSVLQHAWAEIEHDLGYKGAVTIPNEIKRQLSRVSGLLEIADRDFREIRDKSMAYRQRVAAEVQLDKTSELKLDSISIAAFVSNSSVVKELDEYLHTELGYEIRPTRDLEDTLEMLNLVEINTLEELEQSLRTNLRFLKEYAKAVLENHFVDQKDTWLHAGLSVFHLPQIIAARAGAENLAQFYLDACLGPTGDEQDIVDLVRKIDDSILAA